MILPVKLAGHTMTLAGQIKPLSMSLNWRINGLSSCNMTLDLDADPALALGDWVLITAPMGHQSGVFYVKSIKTDYVKLTSSITLEHTFGLLQEMVAFGDITPETIGGSGTTSISSTTAINYLLGRQTETLWTLYQNDFASESQGWKFQYQDIYTALDSIVSSIPKCQWEFDQSSLPWKVSLKAWPTSTTMEMRQSRNIESMSVTVDRSNMFTRVYPTGKKDLHIGSVNGGTDYLEKNVSTWGVISKTLTDSSIDSATLLKAWAQAELDRNSEPAISVSIGGLELSAATGESLDALTIGRLCRVPLPEYNTTVTERIVELAWRDCIISEEQVQVTLANELRTIQSVLYELTKSGHTGKKSNTSKDCDLHEQEEHLEEFDNADIWVNRDSVWAVCGQYNVITDSDGNVHLQIKDGSFLEVERDGVYETVGTSQAITEVKNTVTNTILGSALWTQRNNITGVVGEFNVVGSGANRRLVIKSGGGLNVRRNNVEYGLYDSGNLNAGVIVEKLSDGTTTTKIKSDYIDIAGIVTAEAINAALANASILTSGEITAGSVEATYGVSGATITGDTVNVTTAMNFVGDSIDKQTITIDGVEQTAKFLGTAPLSFSIAGTAKYRAAVSAAGALTGAWSKLDPNDTYAPKYTVTSGTGEDREIIVSAVSPNGWEGISSGNPGSCTVYADAAGGHRAKYTVDGTLPYQQGLADGGGGGGDVVVSGSWNGKTYTAVNNKNSSSVSTTIVVAQGAWTSDWKKTISVSADGSVIDSSTVINGQSVYDTGAGDVDFGSYTFSGDTHITTTRTMYANISNGKSKGLENQLLLDYNSGNGQDGWFGSAPNYSKYVFWRTAPEGTTSWSSRMRGTISGRWVYNKGYSDGYDDGEAAGSSGSSVTKNDITVSDDSSAWGVSSQPNADVRTFALSGRTVNANGSWYRFKVTVKGITKTYCFKTVAS